MPKQNQGGLFLLPAEIDALKTACAYSFPPNRLGYCGPGQSWLFFQEFLSNPNEENAAKAKELLKNFFALYPYLELIAKANNLQPFDAKVIEAYWIGNELLENVPFREMQKTILFFQLHGLPRHVAEKKAAELPDGILPHHSMHVLFVNFISPKVKPIVQNLSNCLVQWAIVKAETSKGVKAKGIELFAEGNELKLKEKVKTVQNPFNLPLREGSIVSIHWGNIVEKAPVSGMKSLQRHTIKNMKLVNSCSI